MGIARKLADLLDNDGDVKLDKQRPAYAKPTNENINYISGLQSALNDKVDDIQVLTNVPSGALFTDTVYTHPTNHAISEISGLQSALDGKTTEAYVNTQVAGIVNTAPATLDTLNELAQALGDDPNYATTTSNLIGTKAPQSTTYTKTETDAKIVALSPPATKAHIDSLNVNAATLSGIASTSFARKDATNFGDFGISGIFFGGALEVSGEVNANTLRGNLVGTFNNIDSSELLTLDGGTLTGNLSLGDNVKANFGAGNDLQIYHDGINSYVEDSSTGAGELILRGAGNGVSLRESIGNEPMLTAARNGAVTLYYDNSEKLSTTPTGIDVTGTVTASSFQGDGGQLSGVNAKRLIHTASSAGYLKDPIHRVFWAGEMGSSSTQAGVADLLTVYHTGHWGQQPWGWIEIFEHYYTGGYRKYFWQADYASAHVTLMESHGHSQTMSLSVSSNTLVCGACHSGQGVWRSVFTATTGAAYKAVMFRITIASNWGRIGYDSPNFKTTFDNTTDTGISGSRIHMHTVSQGSIDDLT